MVSQTGPTLSSETASHLSRIVGDVIERRSRGEHVSNEDILAAHPELSELLRPELIAIARIERAAHDAQRLIGVNGLNDSPAPYSPSLPGYRIISELDTGGQATVWLAVQLSTRRTIAIKVLRYGDFAGTTARKRFEKEARVLATLDHPNIVRIVDRGRTSDGSSFIAMDYVIGTSFDQWCESQRNSDPSRSIESILNCAATLADALHVAHVHGIVHRDLKPSNVRVDVRGQPRVLDFGLARHICEEIEPSTRSELTRTGQILGSLPWSSPEQINSGRNLGAQTDIYSLGVMIYQGLCAVSPYGPTATNESLKASIVQKIPIAPSRTQSRFRSHGRQWTHIDQVLLKALAKAPDQRYRTAAAFAADLRLLASNQAPHIAIEKPRASRKAVVVGLLALLVTATAATAWKYQSVESPTVFQLPQRTNGNGMRFVQIQPGSFTMGAHPREPGYDDEERSYQATITRPYWIGKTEVTVSQYRNIMGAVTRFNADPDDHPIRGVSWDEANEFCRLLGIRDGNSYRLPTETEWEYACRGGLTASYGGTGRPTEMGWIAENAGGATHPVGTRFPNHWGLHDMHGNVAEWCSDYNQAYPWYPRSDYAGPSTAPSANFAWRIVRGGHFKSDSHKARSASRSTSPPESFSESTGFRVVLKPSGTKD